MKKSSKIILSAVLILAAVFYYNLYSNGTFNEVEIEQKDQVKHLLQGKWMEGSFSVSSEEDAFYEFQRVLIEDLNCKKLSVYYQINPTKENHNTFKAFVGVEVKDTTSKLSPDFNFYEVNMGNVLSGNQICSPGYHRIHKALQDKAEEKSINLNQEAIYETFTKTNFYVEMKVEEH